MRPTPGGLVSALLASAGRLHGASFLARPARLAAVRLARASRRIGALVLPALLAACTDAVVLGARPATELPGPKTATWSQLTYIKPRHIHPRSDFGWTLALDDQALLAGAPGSDDCDRGAAPGVPDLTCWSSGAVSALPARPEPSSPHVLLRAPHAGTGDRFGHSLALLGVVALIGAPSEGSSGVDDPSDDSLLRAGAAYPFHRTAEGWVPGPHLKAPGPLRDAEFGASVALDDAWAAVGAPGEPCADATCFGAGAVFLFRRSVEGSGERWPHAQTVHAPVRRAQERFGVVALEGDLLVVGAPGDATCRPDDPPAEPCPDRGAAHLFRLDGDTWRPAAVLRPSGGRGPSELGAAVAIAEGRVLVGAPGEGAVYIFEEDASGWVETARLSIAAGARARFGAALAAQDTRLVVGAPLEENCATGVDPPGFDARCATEVEGPGAAFLFRVIDGAWVQVLYLKPSTARSWHHFGAAVALAEGRVAVGAPGERGSSSGVGGPDLPQTTRDAGAVFLFGETFE